LGTRDRAGRAGADPQGNSFYFILAAVDLHAMVGAWVRLWRLRRPVVAALFWLTVAFFGVFTFSFSGRLNRLDWLFYWADMVALLALAPMLLHFTLKFPERANRWIRTPMGARLLPLLYLPALIMGGARVMAVARIDSHSRLLGVIAALDRVEPLYLGACLSAGWRPRARLGAAGPSRPPPVARIVWGTLIGGAPFAVGYAMPSPSARRPPPDGLLAVPLGLIRFVCAAIVATGCGRGVIVKGAWWHRGRGRDRGPPPPTAVGWSCRRQGSTIIAGSRRWSSCCWRGRQARRAERATGRSPGPLRLPAPWRVRSRPARLDLPRLADRPCAHHETS
jgi:hypothetical protein